MIPADIQLQLQDIFHAHGMADPALQECLLQVLKLRDYDHDQPIIRAGERPTHFYVILSGVARYYYLSPEGRQWNKTFFREGQLIGSLSAHLKQQPCTYSIAAVERCRLASLPLAILDQYGKRFPQLQQMQDLVTRQIMLRNEDREALLLTRNGEQRYQWLLDNEPWLLDRVPQYQLASYLGMDPVSFSRVKRKRAG
ncbi:Crp/Fnr family transcriptional regulator [Pseudomonas sp. JS3066]|jgi:CRP-like cAMP-binding protein|uniref:Crp/Fnr family transcriptional regulator n=1 Tax=unclassified Pseudomonas TaxID=196821 RepID=UPI00129DB21D|nr:MULTISPECIES: Crp/Fnr family transcriptional regulator [unclassified Pseudomonas]MDH4654402.1 Crp/Fnr family transcriptional regulator [Pseudomonas sp. BN606]MRK21190.1 Crp/Fnr family transcriptional regulator [Pseudomonas sp. JG-B]WVK94330.1 Crp/Fnr family transcriptional regulator [Pseudomonas sp. JS3066]